MKFADLHLHTLYSDGTYSAQQLVKEAAAHGLSAIAVVDHDTVLGIEPSMEAGDTRGIEVIPGIELTAEHQGSEIHILGYFIDHKNTELLGQLDLLKKNRIERIYKMSEKLNGLGVDLAPESVFAVAKNAIPGRLHVARALLREGLVKSIYEAFAKFIGDKGPAYVSGFRLSPSQAVALIEKAGGIPVLAHPYVLPKDLTIPFFVECGIKGLEVYYPEHTNSMIDYYLEIAKKYNLLVTGGSDCHGDAKPEVRIGSIKIPYELVLALKKNRKN